MHSVLSKIWTRVAVSISSDDNHYTTSTSLVYICCILTLDRAVNQRCTCVNKRKQVSVMKEYRQVRAAVELVDDRKARVRASLQTEVCGSQRTLVEPPQPRCGRSAKWVLEDNTACYGQEKIWVNIAVCPCLHSSLTHNRTINPFENKVWEIYFYKEVCSFVHWIS